MRDQEKGVNVKNNCELGISVAKPQCSLTQGTKLDRAVVVTHETDKTCQGLRPPANPHQTTLSFHLASEDWSSTWSQSPNEKGALVLSFQIREFTLRPFTKSQSTWGAGKAHFWEEKTTL